MVAVPRRTKVSSISLNIPAAGLGSRPPSIISTSTLDEGGFNEPFPEIKAKLKPHDDSIIDFPLTESPKDLQHPQPDVVQKAEFHGKESEERIGQKNIEAIYAVPHKPSSLLQQRSTTSTESATSQVTVIPQKSVDSDIMYNNPPNVITNSVLAELESQESIEKNCQEVLQEDERLSDKTNESTTDLTDSAIDLRQNYEKSEPFIMMRESLKGSDKVTVAAELQKSEANILDLNDVEFADASDSEEDNNRVKKKVPEADAMTPAEAENLLSSRWVDLFILLKYVYHAPKMLKLLLWQWSRV